MTFLSILSVTFHAVGAVNGLTMHNQNDRQNSIVMFGAHWCAPCMAEYRELPNLVTAAQPDRMVLAWVDREIALRSPKLPTIILLPPSDAAKLARSIAGEGYGLPFSAMFDRHGRLCAVWRSRLLAKDLDVIKARCNRLGAWA